MEEKFTKQQENELINQFAAAAHEAWRKGFDQVYAETGVPSKQRVQKNSDGTEADINVSFDKLHQDWQREKLEAGKAALVATSYDVHLKARKNSSNTNVSYIDIAAEHIHNEWMKRNPKAEWNAAQHVPYRDLPEKEKEKDRVQAREMTGLVETMKKLSSASLIRPPGQGKMPKYDRVKDVPNETCGAGGIPFKKIDFSLEKIDLKEKLVENLAEFRKNFLEDGLDHVSKTPKKP